MGSEFGVVLPRIALPQTGMTQADGKISPSQVRTKRMMIRRRQHARSEYAGAASKGRRA
jgi:hypothetical protein